eukprot:8097970-Alexandrium_andersonii.AAC.1
MALRDEADCEKEIYTGHRIESDNFVLYCQRKLAELAKFEKSSGASLPDILKGKILLRHSRLNNSDAQKISTWLQGNRKADDVVSAL